ncbi:unnamed protein product [Camellia sinensis]
MGSYCRTPFWPTETLIWKAAESNWRHGKVADYQWNVQHSLWEPHQSSATHICEEIDRGRSLGPGGEVHKISMSPPQSKFAVIILVMPLDEEN